ncbi:helix-turn-helix domain-containing protein [Numidum massiliense]|uniref:helix-turn-helix domain-containing protein n=1 Tax=Numidum massiliense TaxID=1522315 RepID=UPI0006D57E63|nr:helix-turn-helix transcriptional regulator [Numidum massiliense]
MLSNRLRELRKQNNLTMKELGMKFNLAESTISGYENGFRKPEMDLIIAFANFFDVSIDYHVGRTDNQTQPMLIFAGQTIELTEAEFIIFNEMKRNPQFASMIHDLMKDPERNVKKMIRVWHAMQDHEHD